MQAYRVIVALFKQTRYYWCCHRRNVHLLLLRMFNWSKGFEDRVYFITGSTCASRQKYFYDASIVEMVSINLFQTKTWWMHWIEVVAYYAWAISAYAVEILLTVYFSAAGLAHSSRRRMNWPLLGWDSTHSVNCTCRPRWAVIEQE